MKVRKIVAIGIGALMALGGITGAGLAGATAAQANNPFAQINVANTEVVLPTTPYVNGTPLNIKQDALTASRLALDLYQDSIKMQEVSHEETKYVPHESHEFNTASGYVYLTKDVMPDFPLKATDNMSLVVNDTIMVRVNMSDVVANLTADKPYVELGDRAIEIIFDQGAAPFLPNMEDYKTVQVTKDGSDIFYLYHDDTGFTDVDISGAFTLGKWEFDVLDINQDEQKVLVTYTTPKGKIGTDVYYKNQPVIMYYDENGELQVYKAANETDAQAKMDELFNAGNTDFVMIKVVNTFIGVKGTLMAMVDYEHATLEKTYEDGDVYQGQWVMDLRSPDDEHVTLYLHVDPDHGFQKVDLKDGDSIVLPLSEKIELVPIFNKDENGTVTGVSYKWVWDEAVKFSYTTTCPVVPAVQPDDVIVADSDLTSLSVDKNIIIIGGWVSNKAWNLLETALDNQTYNALKQDVTDPNDSTPGYALEVIPNPESPGHYIIVAAGVDYEHTREAVEALMAELDKE
jgi:hypothetical protein